MATKEYPKDWPRIRKAVITRDGHKCILCQALSDLEVHHINKHPPDCRPYNLVTLCKRCHRIADSEQGEYLLAPIAQYLSILYPNETRALWEAVTWDSAQDDPFIPSWHRNFYEELCKIKDALVSANNYADEHNGVLVGIANALGINWHNPQQSSNSHYLSRITEALEQIAAALPISDDTTASR